MSYVAADIAPTKIGDNLSAVDTPACIVDLDVVEHNMVNALDAIHRYPVLLRPHMKSHKTPGLVALQKSIAKDKMIGVCCQKVNEAEAALHAGAVDNVLVTNQVVGPSKLARLASLVVTFPLSRVGVLVDMAENVRDLAAAVQSAAAAAGKPFAPAGDDAGSGSAVPAGCCLDVFVEVDVGQRRCGVPGVAEAVELGRLVHSLPGLRLAGVQTYHGGAQHVRAHSDRAAVVASVAAVADELRAAFLAAGLPKPIVTGGGSGTFDLDVACGAFDEVQPGSFIFSDADYARNLDAAGREVRPRQERACVAAGLRMLCQAAALLCLAAELLLPVDAVHYLLPSFLPLCFAPAGMLSLARRRGRRRGCPRSSSSPPSCPCGHTQPAAKLQLQVAPGGRCWIRA